MTLETLVEDQLDEIEAQCKGGAISIGAALARACMLGIVYKGASQSREQTDARASTRAPDPPKA